MNCQTSAAVFFCNYVKRMLEIDNFIAKNKLKMHHDKIKKKKIVSDLSEMYQNIKKTG